MQPDLIKIRIIAFIQDLKAIALTALVTGLIAFLSSPELLQLINNHFGSTIIGMMIMSVVGAILNHLRNVSIINKPQVGSFQHEQPPLL